jgi:hypothetical protein
MLAKRPATIFGLVLAASPKLRFQYFRNFENGNAAFITHLEFEFRD